MLSKILGIIWIILGFLWLLRPESLKNRLKKKMNRKMKMTIYGFMLMFGFLLIVSAIKTHGLLPKIIGLIGVVIIIKAVFLFTAKTSEKILDWWTQRPLIFYRSWAVFVLVTGIMLIFAR